MKTSMLAALVGVGVLVAVPTVALAEGTLVDHGGGPTFVHDAAYAGVRTQVHSWARGDGTDLRLMVRGLPANRPFGAHVHVAPCGSDPLASGGHYQHGSAATLAGREVWLDVTTNADGEGVAKAHIPWLIAAGTAGSVVIHANPTNTTTGAAGARLVCTTVPFGQ